MSKYIKKFSSWDAAKAADDIISPNLTGLYEDEDARMFIKSVGHDVQLKFVGDTPEEYNYANIYDVVNSLSHVTNSNTTDKVSHTCSYKATLTVDEGYEISSVVIKMNDVDVTSTVYSEGEINISSVLGPIVITAIASEIILEEFLMFTCIEDSSIGMTNSGDNAPNIEYKLNGNDWATWDYSTIPLSAGDKVRMKGVNTEGFNFSWNKNSKFVITEGKVALSGNIMSLIDGQNDGTKVIPNTHCFFYLFGDCTGIVSVSENLLTATTLNNYCYWNLFINCTNLTNTPLLPVTELADSCYCNMFANTAITTAPELPATILKNQCYGGMFNNCINLTKAPDLLAPILVSSCYSGMFTNCTNLNYIKCLATSLKDQKEWCTSYWTQGVAATGTFVKSADCTTWLRTVTGIPSGWTVQDA